MDYNTNHNYYTSKPSAPQERRFGLPPGMFQQKSQFGGPSSSDMTRTNAGWTGSSGTSYEQQLEPTINTDGGWIRPTRAGWALPPDIPLGADVVAGSGQTMAKSRTKPVSASAICFYKGKSCVIDSTEAVKKYGGVFIRK